MTLLRPALGRPGLASILTLTLIGLSVAAPASATDVRLAWEDFFVDEQVVADETVLDLGPVSVELDTAVVSDSDGGSFDLAPAFGSDFVTFESGVLGGHEGHINLGFDSQQDNGFEDFVAFQFAFDRAVTDLVFEILDIDTGSNQTNDHDDAVIVLVDGVNVRDSAFDGLYQLQGDAVILDNESEFDGFEGNGAGPTALASQTIGNVAFDFGDTAVQTITILYASNDDAQSNPLQQRIGVSDLRFTVIPEPSTVVLLGLGFGFAGLFGLRRRKANS